MKAPGDISIHLRPTSEPDNRMLVSSLHGGNNMRTLLNRHHPPYAFSFHVHSPALLHDSAAGH